MSKPGMQPVSGKKPRVKKMTIRSQVFHLAGPEKPYPVYPFSERSFIERPGHKPFDGL